MDYKQSKTNNKFHFNYLGSFNKIKNVNHKYYFYRTRTMAMLKVVCYNMNIHQIIGFSTLIIQKHKIVLHYFIMVNEQITKPNNQSE